MRRFLRFILPGIVIIFLVIAGIKLINRPLGENDEGIYATTFLLVDRGYRLYREVFFSQPPGFFLAVYPIFLLLGKTVQAGRLAVFLWSSVAVFCLYLLFRKKKQRLLGLFAVLSFFQVPLFFFQSATLQSDMLVVVFTLLCFVSVVFYRLKHDERWFYSAVFFGWMSFWTKFDFAAVTLLVFGIFFKEKKKQMIIFFLFLTVLLFLFVDLRSFVSNVVELRIDASRAYPFEPGRLLELFWENMALSLILFSSLAWSLIKKDNSFEYRLIRIWLWVSFLSLLLFRPLFPHHLVFIVIPSMLGLLWNTKYDHHKNAVKFLIYLSFGALILNLFSLPQALLSPEEQEAVDYISAHTSPKDFVVSDEAVFEAVSGRLPPSPLSDISQVRVSSGNLSSAEFEGILKAYKPKMVISWNGRLQSLPHFEEMIRKNYSLGVEFGEEREIYLLSN